MKKLLWIILSCFHLLAFAEDSNYSISVGDADKERLEILNEIYNPPSLKFLENYQVEKGAKVLEIGCGIGLTTQALADYVGDDGSVLGTDISEKQIHVAKTLSNKPNLEFRVASAYDLESLNEQFDLVYARFLLTHLPDPVQVLRQIKKVLKPGGKFIVEDICGYETLLSIPHVNGIDGMHFILKQLIELEDGDYSIFAALPVLFEKEGFEVVLRHQSNPSYATPRERKMLTYCVSSCRDALINADRMTQDDYDHIYPAVKQMENDDSIEIQGFDFVQFCVQKKED